MGKEKALKNQGSKFREDIIKSRGDFKYIRQVYKSI